MRVFITEIKKIKRRRIWLLYCAVLAVIFMWISWAASGNESGYLTGQEYYYLLLSLSLVNSVFLPITLACAASRLCDIELKGNTFKLLCTMQPRHSIFHVKLFLNSLYLLGFSLAETAGIPLLARLFPAEQKLPTAHLCTFFLVTFTASFILFLMQQSLSLLSGNQLFPLFFGVGGTFIGIFSAFFPNQSFLRLLPWSFYITCCTVNMYYDPATREVTYFEIPFPTIAFLGFLAFGIIIYFAGKNSFMKKEV